MGVVIKMRREGTRGNDKKSIPVIISVFPPSIFPPRRRLSHIPPAAAFKHLEKCAFEGVPALSEVMYRCFNDTLITSVCFLWRRNDWRLHSFRAM